MKWGSVRMQLCPIAWPGSGLQQQADAAPCQTCCLASHSVTAIPTRPNISEGYGVWQYAVDNKFGLLRGGMTQEAVPDKSYMATVPCKLRSCQRWISAWQPYRSRYDRVSAATGLLPDSHTMQRAAVPLLSQAFYLTATPCKVRPCQSHAAWTSLNAADSSGAPEPRRERG